MHILGLIMNESLMLFILFRHYFTQLTFRFGSILENNTYFLSPNPNEHTSCFTRKYIKQWMSNGLQTAFHNDFKMKKYCFNRCVVNNAIFVMSKADISEGWLR